MLIIYVAAYILNPFIFNMKMNLNNMGKYVWIEVSILYYKVLWEYQYAEKPQVDVQCCQDLNIGPEQNNVQYMW